MIFSPQKPLFYAGFEDFGFFNGYKLATSEVIFLPLTRQADLQPQSACSDKGDCMFPLLSELSRVRAFRLVIPLAYIDTYSFHCQILYIVY